MRCTLSDKCTKCHSTLYTLYSNLTAAIGEDINASDWSRPSKPTEKRSQIKIRFATKYEIIMEFKSLSRCEHARHGVK